MLGVSREYVVTLDMNVKHRVVGPGGVSEGCTVTLADANHCPGAALMLFEMEDGTRHLHTGDFRASEAVRNSIQRSRIHTLFLDTTYFDAKHTLPDQKAVVDLCGRIVADARKNCEKVLIVVTAYNVGKEKLVLKMMEDDPSLKVGVDQQKMKRVFLTHNELALSQRFTVDLESSGVHIWRWGQIGDSPPGNWTFFPNYDKLRAYAAKYKADKIIGIVPTGWCYHFSKKSFARDEQPVDKLVPWLKHGVNEVEINGEMVRYHKQALDNVMVVCVPYSEHSSYTELIKLVEHVRPKIVFPTVVSKENKEANIAKIQKKLQKYCDPQFAKDQKQAVAKRAHLKLFGAATTKGVRVSGGKEFDPEHEIHADITSGDYVEFVKPTKLEKNGLASADNYEVNEDDTQGLRRPTLRKRKASAKASAIARSVDGSKRTRSIPKPLKQEVGPDVNISDVKTSGKVIEVDQKVKVEEIRDAEGGIIENADDNNMIKRISSYSKKDKAADIDKLSGLLPVEMTRDDLAMLLESKGWSVGEAANAYFDNEVQMDGDGHECSNQEVEKEQESIGVLNEDSARELRYKDRAGVETIDLTDDNKYIKDDMVSMKDSKHGLTAGKQKGQKKTVAKVAKGKTRKSVMKRKGSDERLKDAKPKAKQATLLGFFKKADLPAA
ncbi:hypothetical protein SARC_03494 [Sphaeroforma arctica JP610]|uniref:DNA repair metallo-beta-lactamase domain-containing protein n=1 Tax=Sphaeroforma arctica JP610 TaxID=667725 RepID=A0A0L0G7S9_9EUKA|nr:hypothetical protein SARC_03494 [Sphaeroforma arctica JP610]KNC84293.1 hypothetical protein SARC_03494 [Sphaeroforma arctica JP610]|eukprot:XP_014158195.1 hypothetical protein SARC_03494 [Sphaeroforma arctica JP610]